MSYDSNGNVSTQTNQRGCTTTFTNDVMGRTTRVDNPDGSFGTYAYDVTGLGLGSTDRAGIVSSNTFNTRGQATRSVQGVGLALERSSLSQFDTLGRTSGFHDAAGNWSHVGYEAVSRQTGSTDALGNTTGNVYDLAGQLIQYRNQLGQVVDQVYNNRGWVVQTTDSAGNQTSSTYDEVGNRTAYQDALGHRVTTTFDELNRAYQVQTSATQFNTTTFDEVGNVWTTIDAANKTTTFSYDEMNRQKTVTNAANETTTFTYDLASNTTEVINARGKITTTVYDSMNRVVESISPDNERTTTVYAVSGVVEKTINALNQTATMLYDVLNQAVGSINALGQTSSSILDALGRDVGSIDASGKISSNWFDQVGRSIGGMDGLGNTTRAYHDATGNVIRSVDANGNTTEYQYDDLGRLWVTIDPNGGRVTQTYDENGNLETYTDPLGNTTTFVYDTQNREIERIDALGNSLTYAYDARNLLVSQTDRMGRRKDWTYDDLGRVLTETWINADTSTANVLTFAYDANGNMLTAEDDDGIYTLTYDNQDRLETIDGLFGVSLTFAYDALSRRNWVEDSFGGVMSSTYDAAGRLEKRQFGGTSMATLTYERDYADNGEMLAARRYSDLSSTNLIGSTTYGYDAAYRLTNIQHKDGSGTNIAAYTLTFDAGGRITEENRNGTSVTYAYDTRSQLTQAGSDGYSYDDNGNRTMAGYSTGGMNQLLNDGTFTYTYDLEGNVSTKSKGTGLETWYYGYDHNNRLLSVRKTSDGTTDTLTVTYAYDVFGNRVKEDKWSSGPGLVTTKFVYLGQEVYLDLDNSDDVLMRYIQGDTADEMIVRIDGNNVVDWYLTDRLGSVRDIVDYTGALADSITYNGVGMVTAETTPGYMGNVGYAGMRYDSDTGLNTTPHRDYDPAVARWLTQDPILFQAGDPNIYRMVGNNFTNATDPSGFIQVFCDGTSYTESSNPPSSVYRLFLESKEPLDNKLYLVTPIRWNSPVQFETQAWDAAEKILLKWTLTATREKREEPIDLIGWSRGAMLALSIVEKVNVLLAALIPRQPGLAEWLRTHPFKFRSIILIDPVSTGIWDVKQIAGKNIPSVNPTNTEFSLVFLRDGTKDKESASEAFLHATLYPKHPVKQLGTFWRDIPVPLSHGQTGIDATLYQRIRDSVEFAGWKLHQNQAPPPSLSPSIRLPLKIGGGAW